MERFCYQHRGRNVLTFMWCGLLLATVNFLPDCTKADNRLVNVQNRKNQFYKFSSMSKLKVQHLPSWSIPFSHWAMSGKWALVFRAKCRNGDAELNVQNMLSSTCIPLTSRYTTHFCLNAKVQFDAVNQESTSYIFCITITEMIINTCVLVYYNSVNA